MTVSPTQSNVLEALRNFLIAVLPTTGADGKPVQIITAQANRVSEPACLDFCVMTPLRFERLATNQDDTADCKFIGSIAGNVLTISDLEIGEITVGALLFGTGVVPGTVITGLSGSAGNYAVTPAQNSILQTMASGQLTVTQNAKVTVQLDFHGGLEAADMAQTVSTLFRDDYGVSFFAGLLAPLNTVVPLYADDPKQMPFINAEQQYEFRWTIEAELQANQIAVVPQQYADAVEVELISVEAAYG